MKSARQCRTKHCHNTAGRYAYCGDCRRRRAHAARGHRGGGRGKRFAASVLATGLSGPSVNASFYKDNPMPTPVEAQ